jgi:5'-3' exonuclease
MAKIVKHMRTDNVLIVDALNLCFRWKPYKPTEKVSKFRQDFIDTIASLARSYEAGQIIVLADMKGSRYRREIYPDYKGNRKVAADAQTPEQKEQSQAFFAEYEKTLELADSKYLTFRYEGVEADDMAAYLVNRREEYGFNQIWLISSDRDWDLLIKDNVSRFSTVTRKEITLDTWPYDVTPENYLSYKCLTGDDGDNIPGVTKVGPKTAVKLIEQYGSVFDIAEALPIPGKYVYIKNLNEFGSDNLMLNVELMDLETYCEDAIGSENIRDMGQRLIMNERTEKGFGF